MRSHSPLMLAVEIERTDVVQQLLDLGASVSYRKQVCVWTHSTRALHSGGVSHSIFLSLYSSPLPTPNDWLIIMLASIFLTHALQFCPSICLPIFHVRTGWSDGSAHSMQKGVGWDGWCHYDCWKESALVADAL